MYLLQQQLSDTGRSMRQIVGYGLAGQSNIINLRQCVYEQGIALSTSVKTHKLLLKRLAWNPSWFCYKTTLKENLYVTLKLGITSSHLHENWCPFRRKRKFTAQNVWMNSTETSHSWFDLKLYIFHIQWPLNRVNFMKMSSCFFRVERSLPWNK